MHSIVCFCLALSGIGKPAGGGRNKVRLNFLPTGSLSMNFQSLPFIRKVSAIVLLRIKGIKNLWSGSSAVFLSSLCSLYASKFIGMILHNPIQYSKDNQQVSPLRP